MEILLPFTHCDMYIRLIQTYTLRNIRRILPVLFSIFCHPFLFRYFIIGQFIPIYDKNIGQLDPIVNRSICHNLITFYEIFLIIHEKIKENKSNDKRNQYGSS